MKESRSIRLRRIARTTEPGLVHKSEFLDYLAGRARPVRAFEDAA